MFNSRVIPCLLVRGNGLVKTRKFKNPVYIGDPVNAIRIFSEKEVDELVILDIDATREGREPNYELITEMAGEAFMPVAYGGGIQTIEQVRRLIRSGIEKVVVNSALGRSMGIIRQVAELFGSQAIVASVDVKKGLLGGYRVYSHSGQTEIKKPLDEYILEIVEAGAGEILINSIDKDGLMDGYDISLIQQVSKQVKIPVVACGGAGNVADLSRAISEGGASAAAAGSMFVFYGKHRAVLINYPTGISI